MVKVKLVVTGRPPGWSVVRLAVGSIMPQATAPRAFWPDGHPSSQISSEAITTMAR
jgi:hypothetical protein